MLDPISRHTRWHYTRHIVDIWIHAFPYGHSNYLVVQIDKWRATYRQEGSLQVIQIRPILMIDAWAAMLGHLFCYGYGVIKQVQRSKGSQVEITDYGLQITEKGQRIADL